MNNSMWRYCRNCPKLHFMFVLPSKCSFNGKPTESVRIHGECKLPTVSGMERFLEANEMVVRMKRKTVAEIASKGKTDINYHNYFMFQFDNIPKSLMGFVDKYIESNLECIIPEDFIKDCDYYVERTMEKWSNENNR